MDSLRFLCTRLGEIYQIPPVAAGLFRGLVTDPQLCVVGDCLLCFEDFTSSSHKRALLLAPLLLDGFGFSHFTAHWIHTGKGSPFPICQSSARRTRCTVEPWLFYKRNFPAYVDTTLPVPVVNRLETSRDIKRLLT